MADVREEIDKKLVEKRRERRKGRIGKWSLVYFATGFENIPKK